MGPDPFGGHIIGFMYHKQSHKLEWTRAIRIVGTGGGETSEMCHRLPMSHVVSALGTFIAQARCPVGIGDRAEYLNSIKI